MVVLKLLKDTGLVGTPTRDVKAMQDSIAQHSTACIHTGNLVNKWRASNAPSSGGDMSVTSGQPAGGHEWCLTLSGVVLGVCQFV